MKNVNFDERFNWSTGIVKQGYRVESTYWDGTEVLTKAKPKALAEYIAPCFPDKSVEYDEHGIIRFRVK